MTIHHGLSNANCIIVSVMSHNTLHTDWWGTPRWSKISDCITAGNGDTCAILKPNKISIYSYKNDTAEDSKTVTYKIVLMKIS